MNMANKNNDPQMESVLETARRMGLHVEAVRIEGVTPDFIWYESESIIRQLDGLKSRIKHITSVMEQRQADQNKAIDQLLRQIKQMKEEK